MLFCALYHVNTSGLSSFQFQYMHDSYANPYCIAIKHGLKMQRMEN